MTPYQPARQDALRNRYLFEGKLEMQTGLHIGGGRMTLSNTDSPVIVTADDLPFIPGSSFKGALRSTIEKIVASFPDELDLRTCGLQIEETEAQGAICPTSRPRWVAEQIRQGKKTKRDLLKDCCHTCQLFGSHLAAARLIVNDLYLIDEDEWSGTTQIRDGVAIDRDSETAKNAAKYDFEVVPSTTTFRLRLLLENATPIDLQLIAIGLKEFIHGFAGIGGFRSRGLGSCILKEITISYLDLDPSSEHMENSDPRKRLQAYLLRKKDDHHHGLTPVRDVEAFFEDHINRIFTERQEG